ncbi:hypothetical protein AA12467_0536 [Gluconobacter sphaericus NBRC 12467]|nr:hypothetical protein AA12467_0536 [Gluconobacter sphaericus NBRC 12467]
MRAHSDDWGLSDTPLSVLGERREVGFGRIPCQPGQVRKEAAAVSFIRVECPASYLTQITGRAGSSHAASRPFLYGPILSAEGSTLP